MNDAQFTAMRECLFRYRSNRDGPIEGLPTPGDLTQLQREFRAMAEVVRCANSLYNLEHGTRAKYLQARADFSAALTSLHNPAKVPNPGGYNKPPWAPIKPLPISEADARRIR